MIIGRQPSGAYAALYNPLQWELTQVDTPNCRVLLSCSSRPERNLVIAVGAGGGVLHLENRKVETLTVGGQPDLVTVAIDVLGNEWAAGAGSIWAHRPGRAWKRVWHNSTWKAPFMSLLAEAGMTAAVTVDGGILECRSEVFDATRPALA